jgi:anti-sigma factor RsiW
VLLGAGLGYFGMKPGEEDVLAREVVASHVRATLAGQLIEVASSDQHTVKPWLSARLPFSPPVADYSGKGFPLVGARIEYLGGKPAAVLVYRRRLHTIDLYVAPGSTAPAGGPFVKDGFSVECFAQDGMRFWAVSDVEGRELEHFTRLVAAGG